MISYSMMMNHDTVFYQRLAMYGVKPRPFAGNLNSLGWFINSPMYSPPDRAQMIALKSHMPKNTQDLQYLILTFLLTFEDSPAILYSEKLFPPEESTDKSKF